MRPRRSAKGVRRTILFSEECSYSPVPCRTCQNRTTRCAVADVSRSKFSNAASITSPLGFGPGRAQITALTVGQPGNPPTAPQNQDRIPARSPAHQAVDDLHRHRAECRQRGDGLFVFVGLCVGKDVGLGELAFLVQRALPPPVPPCSCAAQAAALSSSVNFASTLRISACVSGLACANRRFCTTSSPAVKAGGTTAAECPVRMPTFSASAPSCSARCHQIREGAFRQTRPVQLHSPACARHRGRPARSEYRSRLADAPLRADSASKCAWLLVSAMYIRSGSAMRPDLSSPTGDVDVVVMSELLDHARRRIRHRRQPARQFGQRLGFDLRIRQPMTSSNSATW